MSTCFPAVHDAVIVVCVSSTAHSLFFFPLFYNIFFVPAPIAAAAAAAAAAASFHCRWIF